MKRVQAGFTMIELIVVIVILGILAATALPKFIDLRGNAAQAAVDGMAGQMGSAMSINYAGCQAVNNSTTGANASKCIKVTNCSDANTLLANTTLPTGYALTAASLTTTNGTTGSCTLTNSGVTPSVSATFTGIAAGN